MMIMHFHQKQFQDKNNWRYLHFVDKMMVRTSEFYQTEKNKQKKP